MLRFHYCEQRGTFRGGPPSPPHPPRPRKPVPSAPWKGGPSGGRDRVLVSMSASEPAEPTEVQVHSHSSIVEGGTSWRLATVAVALARPASQGTHQGLVPPGPAAPPPLLPPSPRGSRRPLLWQSAPTPQYRTAPPPGTRAVGWMERRGARSTGSCNHGKRTAPHGVQSSKRADTMLPGKHSQSGG